MSTITEQAAQRYATAVIDVLAGHLTVDDASYTAEQIVRHMQDPSEPFETCIDFPRNWRLHREDTFHDRWRVRLVCHKVDWTEADIRFSDSVNARLRAIKLED